MLHDMKHYSLPRRREGYSAGGNFNRSSAIRNSMGGPGTRTNPEPLVEYFVPRSVSEFNLSVLVDPPVPPPPPSALRSANARSRDKMVTFEDDRLSGSHQNRKAVALEDVFM